MHWAPESRASVKDIRDHPWFKKDFTASSPSQQCHCVSKKRRIQRLAPVNEIASQPNCQCGRFESPASQQDQRFSLKLESFSQPLNADSMLLVDGGSQTQYSQESLENRFMYRLVKRMTRFFVKASAKRALKLLANACSDLGYAWKSSNDKQVCSRLQFVWSKY